jgi:hypothetical protein
MRAFAIIALLILGDAFCQEVAIKNSSSPDGKYSVTAQYLDSRICYRIHDLTTQALLSAAESDYSAHLSENPEWTWKQVSQAEVDWRPDGRYVAITESNHRHIGRVIIFHRTQKGFAPLSFTDQQLFKFTGLPWERGRSFFGRWTEGQKAAIFLSGRLWHEDKKQFEGITSEITIDLANNGKILNFEIKPDKN